MQDLKQYSIELNLYNKNNPVELTRFFSVSFDTSKVNLSAKRKEKLVEMYFKLNQLSFKMEIKNDLNQ